MDRLGREPDVTHDRNARAHDALDGRRHVASAFELDRVRPAFLDEAHRIADRLFGRDLVAAERHVAHDQRTPSPARDEPGVVDGLVEGDRQGCLLPLHDVPE